MEKRTYKFGSSYLHIVFGDITSSEDEVLVSSDDYLLSMGGGVSASLLRAAGESLLIDAAKKTPAILGDVVVTTAGALSAEHIFHVITIGKHSEQLDPATIIEKGTKKCLELLVTLGLSKISFPSIGTGQAGFSYDNAAIEMSKVISPFLKRKNETFNVTIYLYDRFRQKTKIDYLAFFEQFAARMRLDPEGIKGKQEEPTIEPKKEHQNSERIMATKRLSELSKERDDIEARLAESLGVIDESTIASLEQRLDLIHKERVELLDGLRKPADEGVKVFISYAHEDEEYLIQLKSHLKPLERLGLITSWHDRLISAGQEWKGDINENINEAGVILLLISASFVESEYCFDIELKRALDRHNAGNALVVPILVRPVVWQDLPFAKFQALPVGAKAVSTWGDRDSAWVDVAEGLKGAIQDLLMRNKP